MKITVTRSLVVYAAWIVAFVLPTFVGAAGAPPLLTAEQSEALRKVKTVQLTISEDFGEAKATSVPEVREMLRLMIEASGLRIVEPTEKQSDARFEVTLQGAPLIQRDANGVARFTGATVQCRVQIRTGDVSYSQLIVGERKAWWGDDEGDKYREPEDAPLAILMQETVFAEFPELLDPLPFDHLPNRFRPGFLQQLIDEVEPGLHGHDATVIEFARQPQERVVVRPFDLLALGRALQSAHIVHLQS